VNVHTAFVKVTYEDYARLTTEPSLDVLYQMITDRDSFTDMYDLGPRAQYKDEVKEIQMTLYRLANSNLLRDYCDTYISSHDPRLVYLLSHIDSMPKKIKASPKGRGEKDATPFRGSGPALDSRLYGLLLILVSIVLCIVIWRIEALQGLLAPEGQLPSVVEFDRYRMERAGFIIAFIILLPLGAYLLMRLFSRERVRVYVLGGTSIAIILAILEIVFMNYAQSAADGRQLSHMVWMSRYWRGYVPDFDKRPNPMSLRDINTISDAGDETIFVIGDSFGAGDGIADDRHIFSSLLRDSLSQRNHIRIKLVNLCERGANSQRELENLVMTSKNTGIVPSLVLWEYYANDIEDIAIAHHLELKYTAPSLLERFGFSVFRRTSFLTDFIFWNNIHRVPQQQYQAYLENIYNDPSCISDHLKTFVDAARWCQEHNAVLVVVIFPMLGAPEWSENVYAQKLGRYLGEKLGVPSIDLCRPITAISPAGRMVNKLNPHPSEAVHMLTAQMILKALSRRAH
jgi:hypothetical protein